MRIALPLLAVLLALGCYEAKRDECVAAFADCAGKCDENARCEDAADDKCSLHCLRHLSICVRKAAEDGP